MALGGNVGQPDHVLDDHIVAHEAERWPGAGEEGFAATEHEGVEVESILNDWFIPKTSFAMLESPLKVFSL